MMQFNSMNVPDISNFINWFGRRFRWFAGKAIDWSTKRSPAFLFDLYRVDLFHAANRCWFSISSLFFPLPALVLALVFQFILVLSRVANTYWMQSWNHRLWFIQFPMVRFRECLPLIDIHFSITMSRRRVLLADLRYASDAANCSYCVHNSLE